MGADVEVCFVLMLLLKPTEAFWGVLSGEHKYLVFLTAQVSCVHLISLGLRSVVANPVSQHGNTAGALASLGLGACLLLFGRVQ